MRTLSRPMFNMGGPIKEGVMHGIREPYKGGQLVRPGPGRPGYQGEINPQAWHRKPLKKIVDTAKSTADAVKKANLFKKAGSFFTKGITGPAISEGGIMQMAKNLLGWRPSGLPQRIIGFGSRFPKTGPILPLYGAFKAQEAIGKYTKPANQALSLHLQQAGALDPTSPNFGGQFINTGAATKLAGLEQERLDQINKNIQPSTQKGVPGGGDPRMTYTDPDKASKLAKQRKDDRVNELLKIMGHDQSKKDAVYNALIDASQIVTAAPGGGTLDITKEIISPVIAATSKRFDKPKEIEEAVRLMQTKAEIEAGMPSTKLKDLIAIGIDTPEKQEAYIRTQLGQPTSFGMAKVAAGKNLTGDNAIDAAAAAYAPDTYKGRLLSSKDFKDEKEKYKNKKDSDIITAFTEEVVKEKDYPDGDYVVGTTLVTVTEGKVSNIRR